MFLPRLCACIAASCSFLLAQNVWIVDPAGAGNFTSITAAQNAAVAGDTLVVRGSVPAVALTKSLNVIVESGAVYNTLLVTAPGPLSLHGAFTDVWVSGGVVSLSNATTNLRVENGGVVSARNCAFWPGQASVSGASIVSGSRGVFDNCTFRGRDAYAVFGVLYGTPALHVDGSAELRDCSLIGGAEFRASSTLIPGAAAIAFTGSVDLKNCQLSGASSMPFLSGTGTVRAENTATQGAVALPPSVNVVSAALPWTTGTSALPGGVMQCRLDGAPATLALLFASLGMHRPFTDPFGEYWTEPAGTVVLLIGVTDASGSLTFHANMPTFAPRGLQLTFQSMLAPSTGGLLTSAPAILQIL